MMAHEPDCRQMMWSVLYSMCAAAPLCVAYRITSCHPAQATAKHPFAHKAGRFNNTPCFRPLDRVEWVYEHPSTDVAKSFWPIPSLLQPLFVL